MRLNRFNGFPYPLATETVETVALTRSGQTTQLKLGVNESRQSLRNWIPPSIGHLICQLTEA
jgi:hypothetical protein